MTPRLVLVWLLCSLGMLAQQQAVTIRVDASQTLGPMRPIWSYFGYDEPNYTYAPNGAKLIGELGALRKPVYVRVHNLLTTGDGTPALKWGSTNAYTEDANGKPVYDWTIVDRIFDTLVHAGAKPFVEIGFMPQALSTKPEPYQHSWPKTKIAAGWAYPPKDYGKWADLISAWVRHSITRYGESEVTSWYWEVWNEPDIEYWQGTPEEYATLYDWSVFGVRRVLPKARVGGPASTGPGGSKAAVFLQSFLEHCAHGVNAATGQPGVPLDFISYHAKGRPKMVDGHVEMGLTAQLRDVQMGMGIVGSFPAFRNLPIVLSESDPEGCAACSARTAPQNAYRNDTLYAAYTAESMARLLELADQTHTNLEGMLTWAFEFEGQPLFEGFRTLATGGIDKPVLNFFRMAAHLDGDRVSVQSTGAKPLAEVLQTGVPGGAKDVNALATRGTPTLAILVWNYGDDDVPHEPTQVQIEVAGLPTSAKYVRAKHFRIDHDHSNAFTLWKAMGSPQTPTPEQRAQLERAGSLQPLEPTQKLAVRKGAVALPFTLPCSALSLLELEW